MIRKAALLFAVLWLHFAVSTFAVDIINQPDYLKPQEAEGRFLWLEQCFPGLLVEVWDNMFDATTPVKDEIKINELKNIWLYEDGKLKDTPQYLTFGDANHQNPENWLAGTSAGETCKTIPRDYGIIGLYSALNLPDYCTLQADSGGNDYEYIAQVKIGNYVNQSDASLYSDFRLKGIYIRRGIAVDIELTAGYTTNDPYSENWTVWIDVNSDGVFEYNDEVFFTGSGENTVTGTITIPTTVTPGPKKVRIIMDIFSYAYPCSEQQTIQFGEIEDYTIFVQ